jgi:hypothetical protein
MTVLYTALAIALALASIAAHEWGHLDAMRRLGVDVERFSLGFGPALWSRTLASGLKIQLGALPLGGFVMPRDAAQVDRLSARDNARFSGAGVWVNCALGLVLMGFGGLVGTGYQILLCLILVAVGIAVWLLRRLLGPFHLLLGVIGIALIAYAVLHPLSGPGPSVFAGPIELYKLLVVSNLSDALNDAGAVSLTIGLINSLPLPPPSTAAVSSPGSCATAPASAHTGSRCSSACCWCSPPWPSRSCTTSPSTCSACTSSDSRRRRAGVNFTPANPAFRALTFANTPKTPKRGVNFTPREFRLQETAMHPQSASPTTQFHAALTPAQTTWSLQGITLGFIILATVLRMRSVAATSSLQRNRALRRSKSAGIVLGHVQGGLAWAAFLLYALAGITATGTFIGRLILWCSHTINSLFLWLAHFLPSSAYQDIANLAVGVGSLGLLAFLVFYKGLHFGFDLLEGKAHHGNADGLVFLGPSLFTLVPGWFGQGAATAYGWLGAHVDAVSGRIL